MSEASIDEIISEEDFKPLARERGERFGRLCHTLLGKEQWRWTRRHFYQLIVEADVFEAFLDDHGAGYNRHYRPLRELVASTRGLARAGYAVRHLEARFDSYGTRLATLPTEEARFREAVAAIAEVTRNVAAMSSTTSRCENMQAAAGINRKIRGSPWARKKSRRRRLVSSTRVGCRE